MARDYFDPFLGDKYFEEDILIEINQAVTQTLKPVQSDDDIKNKLLDIKRGIRLYLDRTDSESKKRLKEDFNKIKGNKAIWIILSMGRPF